MEKIRNKRAWLLRAVYDNKDNELYKAQWIGCKAEVTAIRALFIERLNNAIFLEDDLQTCLEAKTGYEYTTTVQKMPNNPYYIGSITRDEDVSRMVWGEGTHHFFSSMYTSLTAQFGIPLLRSFMLPIWKHMGEKGFVSKLDTIGYSEEIYRYSMSKDSFKSILKDNLPELHALALSEPSLRR